MARLTELEKQEVIRYLEADKALPDKYRFLLFEEKREVELVWKGKTNKNKGEIICVLNEAAGKWEEVWTGDCIFGNDTLTIVEVRV